MDDEQELNQLKDAVAQTLESKGVLGFIRAQLRAAVFSAIDTQERVRGVHLENKKLNQLRQTEDGRATIALVHDFLESMGLHSSKSVFLAEISAENESKVRTDASQVAEARGLKDSNSPLLLQMLQQQPQLSTDTPSTSTSTPTLAAASHSRSPTNNANSHKTTPKSNSRGGESKMNSRGNARTTSSQEGKRQNSSRDNNKINSSVSSKQQASNSDTYGDDDYEEDQDFEDVQSEGSDDAFEIADDGLVSQSGSFGDDSSDFLGHSRNSNRGSGGTTVDRSTDSLNMSTSIVQDSMDISVQGSLAMESYDFVEIAQTPTTK